MSSSGVLDRQNRMENSWCTNQWIEISYMYRTSARDII